MNKKLQFFTSINGNVKFAFAVSFIIVISMELWLYDIPEFFNKGHEIGNIFYNICMSTIAATIFYILTYHYKEYMDRLQIYPEVKKKVAYTIDQGTTMFAHLASGVSIQLGNKYPNDEELQIICTQTHPLSVAPLTMGGPNGMKQATWKEYFFYTMTNSQKNIDRILEIKIFLDPVFIDLLIRLKENSFFNSTELFKNINLANIDILDSHKGFFIEYINLLTEVEDYIDNKMRYY